MGTTLSPTVHSILAKGSHGNISFPQTQTEVQELVKVDLVGTHCRTILDRNRGSSHVSDCCSSRGGEANIDPSFGSRIRSASSLVQWEHDFFQCLCLSFGFSRFTRFSSASSKDYKVFGVPPHCRGHPSLHGPLQPLAMSRLMLGPLPSSLAMPPAP